VRTRPELLAFSETVHMRTVEAIGYLSVQWAQIAWPIREGPSNPELGASC
jgi:hypothetical protein